MVVANKHKNVWVDVTGTTNKLSLLSNTGKKQNFKKYAAIRNCGFPNLLVTTR